MSEYDKYISKAYITGIAPMPAVSRNQNYAREQYPSRRYPQQGREYVSEVKPGIKNLVKMAIQEEVDISTIRKETEELKKPWKIPFKWKSASNRAGKQRDMVVVLFLNIKGEIEQPMILPIYGNMILLRNKIYEVDPRAFWILRQGVKMYKFLIVKEIDRRPVSNLDLDEIRRRGDSTDSDEFLIKMALRAQQTQTVKQVNKWVIIVVAILAAGALIYFFSK